MNTLRVMWGIAALVCAAAAQAGGPYQGYGSGYGYDASYGGCPTCNGGGHGYGSYEGCGTMWGCCEKSYTGHDHLWDNYCQEKWCPRPVDPAFSCQAPYWHGGPFGVRSYGCGCSSCGCGNSVAATQNPGYGAATPVSTTQSIVNPRSSGQPRPTESSLGPPQPPKPPMGEDKEPAPKTDKSKDDQPLQLRLLPLSKQRRP